MGLFSSQSKREITLVFDVRDARLTVAAVAFEEGKKPDMLSCRDFAIPVIAPDDHDKHLAAMLATVDQAALDARRMLAETGVREHVGAQYFFFGSPWVMSQAKTIRVAKDRPFSIDAGFLKKVLLGEESSMMNILTRRSGIRDWQVIEEKVLESRLNGYAVGNIIGKQAVNCEIDTYVSFAPVALARRLPAHAARRGSALLAAHSFIRAAYPEIRDFIYVDMNDFVTDVLAVRGGTVAATASFPSGARRIIESASTKSARPKGLVASAVAIRRIGNYEALSRKKMEAPIDAAVETWEKELAGTIAAMCPSGAPKTVFIAPKTDIGHFAAEEMSGAKGNPFHAGDGPADVVTIGDDMFIARIGNAQAFPGDPDVKMNIAFCERLRAK